MGNGTEKDIATIHLQWFADGDTDGSGGTGPGGTGTWRDQLPPELRDDPDVASASKLPEFVESHRRMRGEYAQVVAKTKDALVVPAGTIDDATVDAVFKRLGAPGSPDGYELSKVKLAEGVTLDDFEAAFRAAANGGKLTKGQAKTVYDALAAGMTDAARALQSGMAKLTQERVEALHKKWGNDFTANQEKAQRVFAKTAEGKPYEGELKALLEGGKLQDHPAILEWAADMYKLIGEDTLGGTTKSGQGERKYGLSYPGLPKN